MASTTHQTEQIGSLQGQLLIAMPSMEDDRFTSSVVYMCAHSEEGAMGLVINRPASHITFSELLSQLSIRASGKEVPIHVGGPVETGRGFVLHTPDYDGGASTLSVGDGVGLTATVDILRAIAKGGGPREKLVALGYAGWGPGQLEAEIGSNGWLTCEATPEVVFECPPEAKWSMALNTLGVDSNKLSGETGHA